MRFIYAALPVLCSILGTFGGSLRSPTGYLLCFLSGAIAGYLAFNILKFLTEIEEEICQLDFQTL